jgi:hypothetical protein
MQVSVPHLVAIDGANGIGKSHRAKALGTALSCAVIDCDDFIRDGTKHYPHVLDLQSLHFAVKTSLQSTHCVVVEGVLILAVLAQIGFQPSSHIYVRHNWPAGTLTHLGLVSAQFSEAQLMAEQNEMCRAAGISDDQPILVRELITYHKRRRPHEVADAIVDVCFPIEL